MSLSMSMTAATMAVTAGAGGLHAPEVSVHEAFRAAESASSSAAVTYDEASVPKSSLVSVKQLPADGGGTTVKLRLYGVEANRTFGAHVHTKPCGPQPDDSGPHYQDELDPNQPSTDPDYANPENEVWLDLTTDKLGLGKAESTVDWRFRDGDARSVVIHEHETHTGDGHAGDAGNRLACVNVPFTGGDS